MNETKIEPVQSGHVESYQINIDVPTIWLGINLGTNNIILWWSYALIFLIYFTVYLVLEMPIYIHTCAHDCNPGRGNQRPQNAYFYRYMRVQTHYPTSSTPSKVRGHSLLAVRARYHHIDGEKLRHPYWGIDQPTSNEPKLFAMAAATASSWESSVN